MGKDQNRSTAASSPKKPASKPVNPFQHDGINQDSGVLADVPGILECLDRLCVTARAVMLAMTRDGGAWSITVMDGDARFRQYAHSQDELDLIFEDMFRAYCAENGQ